MNADEAKEVGKKILRDMEEKRSSIIHSKEKKQAVTLGSKRHIKVGGEDIDVDPRLLFQRIITVSNSTVEDVEDLFQYELSVPIQQPYLIILDV